MASLKDIAKIAGVNVSTVCRALNGTGEVNEHTRESIKKIAREMNYTPNISARTLVGKKTNLVGVILPEICSNYYAQMFYNVESSLNKSGYSLVLGITNFQYKNEVKYLNIFRGRKVDGILLIGSTHKKNKEYLDQIQTSDKIPLVLLEPFVNYPDLDCIMMDSDYGIDMAIKHLKKNGHSKIGYISEEISCKYRLSIFKNALRNNGLEYMQEFVKVGKERFELGGYLRMKELMSQDSIPTAIMASYDNMAIGAMKAANELNFRIPEDISIIGFDNIREAEYLTVPLTTVSPPVKDMAVLGVRLLIGKLNDEVKNIREHIVLKPELIIRKTTLKI